MMPTLREKYALAWLEFSTIILFTLIGSLLTLLKYVTMHLEASRSRLETVCDSIQSWSEQIFNAPFILQQASLNSIYTAKENIHRNLSTAVNLVENTIVWLVTLYKSTYRCLLGLAVRTVLSVVTQIAGPVQSAAEGVSSFLHLNQPWSLDWSQSLKATQSKIDQWFKQDDEAIRSLIDAPFNTLQTKINATFDQWQPVFNATNNQNQYNNNNLCRSDQLVLALNKAEDDLKQCIWIGISILLIILCVCTVVNLVKIRLQHSRVVAQQHEARAAPRYDTDEPKQKRKQMLHQLFHFMNHPIAMYCLLAGTLGLTMVYSLGWLVETRFNQIYASFINQTAEWTHNQTAVYTATASVQFEQVNQWINQTELDLNQHVFSVVQSSAVALNDTLNNVVNGVQTLIQGVVGGTFLETPAKELTQCLLLNKIENIEQGLTWIAGYKYIHLTRIDIPQMNDMIAGPKMQNAIHQHINMNDASFVTEQLQSLTSFYYMLLCLWCICLCIGIGFQIKYYFFGARPIEQHYK